MVSIGLGFCFAWFSGCICPKPAFLDTLPLISRPTVRKLASVVSAIVGGSLVLASFVT